MLVLALNFPTLIRKTYFLTYHNFLLVNSVRYTGIILCIYKFYYGDRMVTNMWYYLLVKLNNIGKK